MKSLFIEQPILAQLGQRALDIPGEGFGMAQPEVQAGVQLADLTDQQFKLLAGIRCFSAGGATPTNAAAQSGGLLRNPSFSGRILRVTRMTLYSPAATMLIAWGVIPGPIPTTPDVFALNVANRDSRLALNVGATAGQPFRVTMSAGVPFNGHQIALAAGQSFSIDPECTVAPGPSSYFFMIAGANNQGFSFSLDWEERAPSRQELNLPGG